MKKLKKQESIIERIIYLFLTLFIAGSFSVGVTLIFLFFKSPELEVVNIEKSEIIEEFVFGVILGILAYTGLISNKKKSRSQK